VTDDLAPGAILTREGTVTLNEGRETAEVTVGNTGDRPVQVGSHVHFFEANAALAFDRRAALGMRLDIPAGTAVRFEPGERQTVGLVALGGKRRAHGVNGLVDGDVDGDPDAAMRRLRERGFADTGADDGDDGADADTDTEPDETGAE
jgi:urease subunit beta